MPPPPGMPPPGLTSPAALAASSAGATVGASGDALAPTAEGPSDLGQDIMVGIQEQVKTLLGQARRDSEAKVKAELKAANDVIQSMDQRLDEMLAKLDGAEEFPPQVVEQHTVAQALAKVEQNWGKELGKLKQELHQTIFAHNHNADLMKHQKDSIDEIRSELEKQKPLSAERVKMAKAHLQKVQALMEKQDQGRRLEPLFNRLSNLERRIPTIMWR